MLFPSVFRNNFFDDFNDFMDFPTVTRKSTGTLMKSDVKDAGDHFELDMDLPGFKKEDVKLQLKDDQDGQRGEGRERKIYPPREIPGYLRKKLLRRRESYRRRYQGKVLRRSAFGKRTEEGSKAAD